MHQWNVKIYGASEEEHEALRDLFAGDEDYLRDEFGIKDATKVFFGGRSGGWLVVDRVLTVEQVQLITEAVNEVKANWKTILRDMESML